MSNKVLITNSQKAVKVPSGLRLLLRRPVRVPAPKLLQHILTAAAETPHPPAVQHNRPAAAVLYFQAIKSALSAAALVPHD